MDQIPDGTFLWKNQKSKYFAFLQSKGKDIFTMILKPKIVK